MMFSLSRANALSCIGGEGGMCGGRDEERGVCGEGSGEEGGVCGKEGVCEEGGVRREVCVERKV